MVEVNGVDGGEEGKEIELGITCVRVMNTLEGQDSLGEARSCEFWLPHD